MHGPWHMPEHPDEADNSAEEREREEADELARLEAFAVSDPVSLEDLEGQDHAPHAC